MCTHLTPTVNVRNDAPVVNFTVPEPQVLESRAKVQRIEHDANGRIAKVITEMAGAIDKVQRIEHDANGRIAKVVTE